MLDLETWLWEQCLSVTNLAQPLVRPELPKKIGPARFGAEIGKPRHINLLESVHANSQRFNSIDIGSVAGLHIFNLAYSTILRKSANNDACCAGRHRFGAAHWGCIPKNSRAIINAAPR